MLKIAEALEVPIEQIIEHKDGEILINTDNVIKPVQIICNFNINISTTDKEEVESLLEIINKFKNL